MARPSQFKPSPWLKSPHLQTIFPTLLRRKIKFKTRMEYLTLPDGDFIDLRFGPNINNAPIVILIHGLGGCIDSQYAKGLLKAAHAAGFNTVFMHFRGASIANKTPKSYHGGATDEFSFLFKTLKQRNPNTDLIGIGVSLGANALLKYLGDGKQEVLLSAAIAISTPFDLAHTSDILNSGFSKIYRRYLLNCANRPLFLKIEKNVLDIPKKTIKSFKTFREFDENITAPLHGYSSANHYYQTCSCKQYLKHIQTPTLIIQAEDDPFVPKIQHPKPHELSNTIQFECSKRGGHVGFVGGTIKPTYWLEKRVVEYLQSLYC
jgi:uncharacterized protein